MEVATLMNEPILYLCISVTSLLTALVASKTLLTYHRHLKSIWAAVYYHLEDWALFLFTVFWLLCLTFPYGCCVVFRWTVTIYMKLRYGELGDISTGLDSAGSVDIPGSRQIIKSLKVLKGTLDLELLRERVKATACRKNPKTGRLQYPKFHQYLDFCAKYYCWKPAKFEMDHHVRYVDGLDETSPSISESQALEIVSKYSNEPFTHGRGYWEILVIPKFHYDNEEVDGTLNLERDEKFAILIRISHGIGDGFSFLKLVMRDMAGIDKGREYVPPSKSSGNSFLVKTCIFFYMLFKSPRAFYKEMRLKDKNPMHNPEVKITGEKVHLWTQPLSMEWLKQLRIKMGSGMSSVLLESLSGACRSYMTQQVGLSEQELPQTISTIIPVPAPNHPNDQLVNKFSIVMMPLELKTKNVHERCKAIDKSAKIMSRSPDCYMNLFLMDLVAVFPVALSKYFMVNTQCTAVISNLPGPTETVQIWGWDMLDTMFWLPNVGSSGISVSYLSYENKLRIGLAIDTGAIPDGQKGAQILLDGMIQDLVSLAGSVNLSTHDMFIATSTKSEEALLTREISNKMLTMEKVSEDRDTLVDDHGYGDEGDLSVDDEGELKIKDDQNKNTKNSVDSMKNTTKATKVLGTMDENNNTILNQCNSTELKKLDKSKDYIVTYSVTSCRCGDNSSIVQMRNNPSGNYVSDNNIKYNPAQSCSCISQGKNNGKHEGRS